MTVLTVLYALVVGLLLTGAAALAESALRTRRRPARWTWAAALVLTASAPVWGPRFAPSGGRAGGELVVAAVVHEETVGGGVPAAEGSWLARARAALETRLAPLVPALQRADRRLALAWMALSAAALTLVALSLGRLHRRVARLPRGRVGGDEVRLAPDFGPACVGLARSRVVLPRWILGLEPDELDLVLRHERAHGEARDPLLLTLGLVALAAAPWNPPLWWQVVRLRRAVELDCDRRVLATGAPPAAYGHVLVRVLARVRTGPFPAPALLDPVSFLERRLTLMRQTRPGTWTRTIGAAALATGLVILACETPAPSPVEPTAPLERADRPPPPADASTVELADAVEIRGLGALPENATLVVDGVIIRGETLVGLELDPARIERIEVVKGTDAPVIEITTIDASVKVIRPSPPPEPTPEPASFEATEVLLRPTGPEPVVYVDGVRVEGGMIVVRELIKPDAIEKVEVIKGEAARVLLGDEALNGVIRITTKKTGGG
jgi:hypothetical protein